MPPGGPFNVGIKMEKVCCVATSTGLEHGALSSYARMFAPAPSTMVYGGKCAGEEMVRDFLAKLHSNYFPAVNIKGGCGSVVLTFKNIL